MPKNKIEAASADRIEKDLRHLTETIGPRLAGSKAERSAADFILKSFKNSGADARIEEFPVRERAVKEEKLEIKINGKWQKFACSLFGAAPGTGGKTLEAELCFFEAEVDYQRKDISFIKGKAVVHLGCHIENAEDYRRLMAAKPAFLLFVDVRYPAAFPLADGLFPAYVGKMGALPTVNIAYLDAWGWKQSGASRARLKITGGPRDSLSTNVAAEISGSDASSGVIFAGGHHDTQAGCPGADDNGSGVVCLMELARLIAPLKLKRAVRLISFGAEEQLSVGSASYVRAHRKEIEERGLFMFNFDSSASPLGWTEINFNGPEKLKSFVTPYFHARDIYFKAADKVIPYTDQFPFAVCGLPGLWIYRPNCAAGRFFHHRADEDMSKVSCGTLARQVSAAAAIIADLAAAKTIPFKRVIPEKQAAEISRMWKNCYGGWKKN